jgi:hypothetical protein
MRVGRWREGSRGPSFVKDLCFSKFISQYHEYESELRELKREERRRDET